MSNYIDSTDLFIEPKTKQYGNHMVMTNVHKSTKTKYVNLDTTFRDEYNSSSLINYNITLPERITEVKNMTVKCIELPNTIYNISSSIGNNYFKVTDNSNNNIIQTITIPDGNYNGSTIQTAINTAINASLIDTNNIKYLSYVYVGGKSQFITSNPSPSFTIDFDTDSSGNFDKYNIKEKLGWLLGFRNITYVITKNNTSITSEKLADFSGSRYLYLAIDEFKKGNQNSFISSLSGYMINKNIIARISMNNTVYPFGSILPANHGNGLLTSDVRSYTGKIDIQKLNIQLLNEIGLPVNLNGMDFSFCIEVEHEA